MQAQLVLLLVALVIAGICLDTALAAAVEVEEDVKLPLARVNRHSASLLRQGTRRLKKTPTKGKARLRVAGKPVPKEQQGVAGDGQPKSHAKADSSNRGKDRQGERVRERGAGSAQGPVVAKDAANREGGSAATQRVSADSSPEPRPENWMMKPKPKPKPAPLKVNPENSIAGEGSPQKLKPLPKVLPGDRPKPAPERVGGAAQGEGFEGKPRPKVIAKDRPAEMKLGPKLKPKPAPLRRW